MSVIDIVSLLKENKAKIFNNNGVYEANFIDDNGNSVGPVIASFSYEDVHNGYYSIKNELTRQKEQTEAESTPEAIAAYEQSLSDIISQCTTAINNIAE